MDEVQPGNVERGDRAGWTRIALLLTLGAALALSFIALPELLSASFGATLASRCALLAACFLALRLGSRTGAGSVGVLLLVAAVWMILVPWLPFLHAPLGTLPGKASFPAIKFALRLLFALVVVGVPGFATGAALGRLLPSREEPSGWRGTALDYALLFAGGSLGAMLAGALASWGGERFACYAAGGGLFACAVLCGLQGRGLPAAAAASLRLAGMRGGLALWGGLALALWLAWERALVALYGPFFPGLTARALVLVLGGCALGCLLLVLWPYAEASALRLPLLALMSGLGVAWSLAFMNEMPMLFLSAVAAVPVQSASFALRWWGIGLILVGPASLSLGAMLPTLVSQPGRHPERAAAASSGPWLVSLCDGAVLAAPIVAFLALPLLGYQKTLAAGMGLLLAYAALTYARSTGAAWKRALGIFATLVVSLAATWALPRGNPKLLASGAYLYWPEILKTYKDPHLYREKRLASELPFYREGADATVAVESVMADESPILAITVDGAVAATTYYDLVPQILSAEIPMLMLAAPQSVFVAGYGSGLPASSLLLHPLKSLDVAESEPAVVEASRSFEPANRTPRADPRLHLFLDDPRQVLSSRPPRSYDLILSRPSAPEGAAARGLWTAEFFRLAASRLKPGGLFALVVPLQGLDLSEAASVLRTMQAGFGDVVVMQTYYYELLLLGSDRKITFAPETIRKGIEDTKIGSDLARIGLADPDALIVRFRLADKGAQAFARAGSVLRDAGAPLGWAGYQVGGEAEPVQTLQKMDEFSTGLPARIAGLPDGAPGNATLIGLARSALRARDAIRAADLAEAVLARGDVSNGHQILGDACAIQREQLKAVQEWHQALAADPANVNALLSLADFNMDRTNYADAERYLSQALHIRPDDPDILFARGRVLYLLKRYPESEKDLARSLAREGDEEMPLALYYLGLIQQQKGNLEGAAELLRRYLQWGYRQGKLTAVEADVHLALADVYTGLKLPDLADQQRKAGEALKSRLQESAREQRRAYLDFLLKP